MMQTIEAALAMCCGGRQALAEEFKQAGEEFRKVKLKVLALPLCCRQACLAPSYKMLLA